MIPRCPECLSKLHGTPALPDHLARMATTDEARSYFVEAERCPADRQQRETLYLLSIGQRDPARYCGSCGRKDDPRRKLWRQSARARRQQA